jgi:hypothetical protein
MHKHIFIARMKHLVIIALRQGGHRITPPPGKGEAVQLSRRVRLAGWQNGRLMSLAERRAEMQQMRAVLFQSEGRHLPISDARFMSEMVRGRVIVHQRGIKIDCFCLYDLVDTTHSRFTDGCLFISRLVEIRTLACQPGPLALFRIIRVVSEALLRGYVLAPVMGTQDHAIWARGCVAAIHEDNLSMLDVARGMGVHIASDEGEECSNDVALPGYGRMLRERVDKCGREFPFKLAIFTRHHVIEGAKLRWAGVRDLKVQEGPFQSEVLYEQGGPGSLQVEIATDEIVSHFVEGKGISAGRYYVQGLQPDPDSIFGTVETPSMRVIFKDPYHG